MALVRGSLDADRCTALTRALAPWRAQLRWQGLLTWALRGVVAGTGCAVLIGLAARLTPLSFASLLAGALVALAVVAGGLVALLRVPSTYQTARRVDVHLQLADRLATAWEATGEEWPLARLQAQDALRRLEGYLPARDLPLHLPRRELRALGAALAVAFIVWALPNPMHRVLQQREEARAKVAEAAEKVKETEQEAIELPALSPEERRAIQQVLDQLQRDLSRAPDVPEALAALSQAEDRLRQLSDPAAKEKAGSLSSLARSLSGDKLTALAGEAIARSDPETTRQALAELAQSLPRLRPEERRGLAETLQAVANEVAASAQGQAGVSGKVREAARAAASGDAGAGAVALGELADDIAGLQEDVTRQEQLGRVARDLRSARERVAGVASAGQVGTAGRGQGAEPSAGTSAASAEGEATDQGSGRGQEQGGGQISGQGQGAGQDAGRGQGSGQGQGLGSIGQPGGGGGSGGREGGTGAGSDALGAEATRLQGADEQVFIPGQEGAGPTEQTGVASQPIAGTFRPYSEVVAQYGQAAREHVARSAIPPALKETVRQYFAGLEGR